MTMTIDSRRAPAVLLISTVTMLQEPAASAGGWQGVGEFEEASIHVERNATDGDTEIVLIAKPLTGDGLVRLTIVSPHWRKVLEVEAASKLGGLREFHFETPEPEDSAILRSYPEGSYLYFGTAADGRRFVGSAALSHELPGEVTIIAPRALSMIAPGALTIVWSAVPDAEQYIVELENESADPEQSFSFNVGSEKTSFVVPSPLVVPRSEYQIGVASVHENGNVVFTETTFSTSD